MNKSVAARLSLEPHVFSSLLKGLLKHSNIDEMYFII